MNPPASQRADHRPAGTSPLPHSAWALGERQRARVAALRQHFERVHTRQMKDVALLHPRIAVDTVGFAPDPLDPPWLVGVVITPWFMNLVRLPESIDRVDVRHLRTGESREVTVGETPLPFLGAWAPQLGFYEACSLFSPMHGFADATAARATALEVLAQLQPRATGHRS